jgi:hypothetical protein
MDTNCTMNYEIVPKSIDWLRPAQKVSAHHKETINKYAKYANYAKYVPGLFRRREQVQSLFAIIKVGHGSVDAQLNMQIMLNMSYMTYSNIKPTYLSKMHFSKLEPR